MKATPHYGLRAPELSDVPDVPQDLWRLAEDVDKVLLRKADVLPNMHTLYQVPGQSSNAVTVWGAGRMDSGRHTNGSNIQLEWVNNQVHLVGTVRVHLDGADPTLLPPNPPLTGGGVSVAGSLKDLAFAHDNWVNFGSLGGPSSPPTRFDKAVMGYENRDMGIFVSLATASPAEPSKLHMVQEGVYVGYCTLSSGISSRRYKTDIVPLEDTDVDAVAWIDSLVPVRFRYRDDLTDWKRGTTNIGLIAEDVKDASDAANLPDTTVVYNDGQVDSFDDRSVLVGLVAKVHELTRRIEALENAATSA